YKPFTIIKDAQRHGLKVLPVDVTQSNWECVVAQVDNLRHLRLGLLCVKGLREEAGRAIVRARGERSFSSLDDLHRRVPELRKDELRKLAAVGALNHIEGIGDRVEGLSSTPIVRNPYYEIKASRSEPQSFTSEVQTSTPE